MDRQQHWLRIGDLERRAKVPRRTIHFYLQEGLLHPPVRTGKTMAYYDEAHLGKLKFIDAAKREGLPLAAIREEISAREKAQADIFGRRLETSSMERSGIPRRQSAPRKAHGIKTRDSILQSGCRFFRQKGYKETNVSDITKELNIGKGTFYFYFSDKKELFLECVPLIFGELFALGWDKIRREADPLKRLELRAEAVLPVLKEFAVIIRLCKEALDDSDPKLNRLGEEIFLSIRRPLESDIEKGVAAGIIRPVDPKLAGALMIGIIESLYYLQAVDGRGRLSGVSGDLFDLLAHGLTQRPRRG